MNKIISSIEWLEAFSVNGVPLADIGLLVTWLLIAITSLGIRWPSHDRKNRSSGAPDKNRLSLEGNTDRQRNSA